MILIYIIIAFWIIYILSFIYDYLSEFFDEDKTFEKNKPISSNLNNIKVDHNNYIDYWRFDYHNKLNFVNKIDCWNLEFNYKKFKIPKKTLWYRTISTPNKKLKKIQQNMVKNFNLIYLPNFITWFRKHFSIKSNAKQHIKKDVVINLDIKDFFDNVTNEKIYDRFKYLNIDENIINKIIKLTTLNNSLPQWAPTSPFMANFVFIPMDFAIISILKKYDKDVSYTRYADNISISSNNWKIVKSIKIIKNILYKHKYRLNSDKIFVNRSHTKQSVTWLVVNEKVSYPRNKYMLLRSIVYNYLKNNRWDFNKIKWNLSFFYFIDKKKYFKLRDYYLLKFSERKVYKLFKNN